MSAWTSREQPDERPGTLPKGYFAIFNMTHRARPGHEMGTGRAQSKTPTLRSALNYSKLLFLFGNFGCEGRI
jgi:hypothetical protein